MFKNSLVFGQPREYFWEVCDIIKMSLYLYCMKSHPTEYLWHKKYPYCRKIISIDSTKMQDIIKFHVCNEVIKKGLLKAKKNERWHVTEKER